VGYLEQQQGLPPGKYSPPFLEIDKLSGPWLTKIQQESLIAKANLSEWDLNIEEGVIRFGDKERFKVMAAIQLLGTYSPDDGQWLWAWSNPETAKLGHASAVIRDKHEDVPELQEPTFKCTETKAWALAAAAAHQMEAQGCYRLPGEIQTFIALFDITELSPEDPRGELLGPDPEVAQQALAEYAGPMAMNIGGLLLDAVKGEALSIDEVISVIHTFSDNLEEITQSPAGKGTPAAAEASQLAKVMRQAVLCLSVPDQQALMEGAKEVLGSLQGVARRYGAWPGDMPGEAPPGDGGEEGSS